jgi:hypothetical protein
VNWFRKFLAIFNFTEPKEMLPKDSARIFTPHKGWGNAIGWTSELVDGVGTLSGFKSFPKYAPGVGDIFIANLVSGKKGIFIFTSVEHCGDPSDMFFADIVAWKYLEDASEEEIEEYSLLDESKYNPQQHIPETLLPYIRY